MAVACGFGAAAAGVGRRSGRATDFEFWGIGAGWPGSTARSEPGPGGPLYGGFAGDEQCAGPGVVVFCVRSFGEYAGGVRGGVGWGLRAGVYLGAGAGLLSVWGDAAEVCGQWGGGALFDDAA